MIRLLCTLLAVFSLAACTVREAPTEHSSTPPAQTAVQEQETPQQSEGTQPSQEEAMLKITVGDRELLAALRTTAPQRNSKPFWLRGR